MNFHSNDTLIHFLIKLRQVCKVKEVQKKKNHGNILLNDLPTRPLPYPMVGKKNKLTFPN